MTFSLVRVWLPGHLQHMIPRSSWQSTSQPFSAQKTISRIFVVASHPEYILRGASAARASDVTINLAAALADITVDGSFYDRKSESISWILSYRQTGFRHMPAPIFGLSGLQIMAFAGRSLIQLPNDMPARYVSLTAAQSTIGNAVSSPTTSTNSPKQSKRRSFAESNDNSSPLDDSQETQVEQDLPQQSLLDKPHKATYVRSYVRMSKRTPHLDSTSYRYLTTSMDVKCKTCGNTITREADWIFMKPSSPHQKELFVEPQWKYETCNRQRPFVPTDKTIPNMTRKTLYAPERDAKSWYCFA